jgi:uncharacterized protein (DUF169 family)
MENIEKNREISRRFKESLSISGNLVAIKMLREKDVFQNIKGPKKNLTLCQHVAQAYYLGRSVLLQAEDMYCYASGAVLGLRDMPEKAWRRYVGWARRDEEAARKSIEAAPKLKSGVFKAGTILPLQNCPVEPDVVVFAGSAAQMGVVIGAYLFSRGGSLNIRMSGMISCGTIIATPLTDQTPVVTLPGNAPRILAFPSETDLLCGIPGGLLDELIDHMNAMAARGAGRFPPAWQHIGQEPPAYIKDLLKYDGEPSWLKK